MYPYCDRVFHPVQFSHHFSVLSWLLVFVSPSPESGLFLTRRVTCEDWDSYCDGTCEEREWPISFVAWGTGIVLCLMLFWAKNHFWIYHHCFWSPIDRLNHSEMLFDLSQIFNFWYVLGFYWRTPCGHWAPSLYCVSILKPDSLYLVDVAS